jgi:diadenosine tetraphosphate (Ap4A) HIT family hydrolase
VHVIARQRDDDAWPGPVWGVGKAQPYDDAAADALIDGLRQTLS